MVDYYPVVARAVSGLPNKTGEARRAVYERARKELLKLLSGPELAKEQVALEAAIQKVEAECLSNSTENEREKFAEQREIRGPRWPLWPWMLAGSIWLLVAGWNFTHYWSGEPFVSDSWYLSQKEPASWGDQHPECRDQFGFWPDGTRMEPKEFEKAGGVFIADIATGILSRQKTRTPEQIARDDWAHDVRRKVAACEEPQWMPVVIANEIRQARIRVITFALLPPFLFLSGLGLIRRATGKISMIAAKCIATVGALGIAVVTASVVGEISDKFFEFVIPNLGFHPASFFWSGLDVICAVLIPIGIVLWWRRHPGHRPAKCRIHGLPASQRAAFQKQCYSTSRCSSRAKRNLSRNILYADHRCEISGLQ